MGESRPDAVIEISISTKLIDEFGGGVRFASCVLDT